MTRPLWTLDEIVAAIGPCRFVHDPEALITGVSIDTRTLSRGDLFVALKDVRDGHEFVPAAFARGAAAALVATTYDGSSLGLARGQVLIQVANPLRALEDLGKAARARTRARIVAVTGSVGKTGTKEMLRLCLQRCASAPELVHASAKSYNNHWGVPLTLARMPAETEYGVFEIGMNHPGEIAPLSRMVRPHAVLITTVEPVHLGHFESVEAIADAKAEILAGLEPGGVAILNRDNPHYERLARAAHAHGAKIAGFGEHSEAQTRLLAVDLDGDGSVVQSRLDGRSLAFRVGAPGRHIVQNALGALTMVAQLGADPKLAAGALAGLTAPSGRGAREVLSVRGGSALLIDESYNASPASMRAALSVLATVPRETASRRVVVLGDMRELGDQADRLHLELSAAVTAAGVDLVFAAGPHMRLLFEALPKQLCAKWAQTSAELHDDLLTTVAAGDVVMIKGSLGSRMGPLVEALRSHFGPAA